MNKDNEEQEKELMQEKKMLNSLYEEELNLEVKLKQTERKEIALVAQLDLEFISKVMKKFEEY
jgi:hypothetical protein